MRSLVILTFLIIPIISPAQIRFKMVFDGGAGWTQNNLYTFNWGINLEKKIAIDQSIETGLYYHNLQFYIKKDQYNFYQSFMQGTPNAHYYDSISDIAINFNCTTIPLGFSYYLSPKWYINYKAGFNFISRGNYQGVIAHDTTYTNTDVLFKAQFDQSTFKKFYLNHTISINRIFLRRFDVGFGFMFTPKSSFFKESSGDIYKSFNQQAAKYVTVTFNFKIFFYQLKTNKI